MSKKIGIQGGRGSFNHQGWLKYSQENNLENYEIVFLHTTKNVLTELENKTINKGQFGIYNTLGGLVEETTKELGRFKFSITDWYKFKISHCLMKKKGISNSNITKIMAHPQGFKQCKGNLEKLFPDLEKVINEGERIDHAKIAEDIANGSLDSDIAVIGPAVLAEIYGLEIIRNNLEDSPDNFTTFVLVE